MCRHTSPPHCLNTTSLAAPRRSDVPGGPAWRKRTDCDCASATRPMRKMPRRQAVPCARGARAYWSRRKKCRRECAATSKREREGGQLQVLQTSAARSKGEPCAGWGSQQAAMPATRMALRPAGQLKVRQDQWRKRLVQATARSAWLWTRSARD